MSLCALAAVYAQCSPQAAGKKPQVEFGEWYLSYDKSAADK